MENSNNWIDEAFKSVQHQKKSILNADVFSKIEQRLNKEETKVILIPIWKVAVAVVVIIFINLKVLKNVRNTEQKMETTEYQLGTNYNFYSNE